MSNHSYDRSVLFEDTGTTTGSDYNSAWIDTGDALEIRVAGYFPGSGYAVSVYEAVDTSGAHTVVAHSLGNVSGNIFSGGCTLTARYFMIRVASTVANEYHVVARATKMAG
jgi:hypothetical protein